MLEVAISATRVLDLLEILVIVAICAVMGGLAHWRGLLTPAGSAGAACIGALIGIFGGISWVLILLVFLLSGFAATRYRFEAKRALGMQEGKRGERGLANVLGNGAVACACAILHPFIGVPALVLFLTAVAVAAADTLASELGVLSPKAYLITSLRRVAPGTDGGISASGTAWAFVAASYVSVLGNLILFVAGGFAPTYLSIILPAAFGLAGCMLDSLFGATLESRGILTKQTNNLYSIALATLMAALVVLWAT